MFEKINMKEKKNQLIEELRKLVPNVFDDGEINIEKLKEELDLENETSTNEKYGFNWVGKSRSRSLANILSNKTLVPQRDKSMNFDESDNIIIEGDNLEVLRLLSQNYFGKVDVIYIDPPYNTGNDFIYNDDFSQTQDEFNIENNLVDENGYKNQTTKNDKSNGKFHTNWLNMMYPRLLLARKLLKEDGVIFISIDDNEQARLKMICDEIFGEQNFVSCLIWKARRGGGNDAKNVAIDHEYIMAYSKNKIQCKLIGKLKDETFFKLKDEFYNTRGGYYLQQFDWASLTYTSALDYEIITPDGSKLYPGHVSYDVWVQRRANNVSRTDWRWMMSKQTFDNANKNGFIHFEFDNVKNQWNVKVKTYQKSSYKNQNSIERFLKLRSVLDNEFGITRNGNQEIDLLKLKNQFSYPKPSLLIKNLLSYFNESNSLILDFFAGSGTTGQAVMELNKEDGGNRKFILVQLPEESENLQGTEFETIADITRERIKRSIDMYEYKEKGFKAFKLTKSNLKSFDASTGDSIETIEQKILDIENKIKPSAKIEDVVYEIILRVGKLPLDTKIKKEVCLNNEIYLDEDETNIFILEKTKGSNYYENIIDVVKTKFDQKMQIFEKSEDFYFNVFLNDQLFKSDKDKINFAEQVKNLSEKIKLWVI